MLLEEGETTSGALGLQAATMGNGVCRAVPSLGNGTANSSSIRGLADSDTSSHRDMFSKLEMTPTQLDMTSTEALSWAPGALSYCARGIPTLLHKHLLASPSIMSKWVASGNLNSTQRSYVQGSIHSKALVAIEGIRSQLDPLHPSDPLRVLKEMLSTPTNCKTWVEELQSWLQLNPLSVNLARVAARQAPILTATKDLQDGQCNFMDHGLVLTVAVAIVESGTLRGSFIVESQITAFELKNNLLERLAAQPGTDYMLGTLQGPLYDSSWLSEYVWEESKLLFLVPLHPLESRLEAWMRLTVCQEWRRVINSREEQDHPKQRSWYSPIDPGLGAVVIIHSLTIPRGQPLNGNIGLISPGMREKRGRTSREGSNSYSAHSRGLMAHRGKSG